MPRPAVWSTGVPANRMPFTKPALWTRYMDPLRSAGDCLADLADPSVRRGILLRKRIFPALRLSVSQAARELRITRQTLHRMLAGRAAVMPSMAVRLDKDCGRSAARTVEIVRNGAASTKR